MPLPGLFGAALLLAGAGAVVLSFALDSSPTPKLLGDNVPVNAGATDPRDRRAHNSPALVRSPADEKDLAIANRIDAPGFSCALHSSSDAGASWRQVPIPVPRGEEPKCHGPDVAFAADGTLYLAFVTLKGKRGVPNAVWISRSKDGGRTLSRPSRALGPRSFQVRLAADPTAPGRIYLTYLEAAGLNRYGFTKPGNAIRLRRSANGGRSWGAPLRVSSPSRGRVLAATPAAGPGRALSVLYLDLAGDRLDYEGAHRGRGGPPHPGPWRLVLARSQDGGSRWRESVVEDELKPSERLLALRPASPSLEIDPDSGRTYAGFHDRRLGDPDVFVWASEDGGQSWKKPVRVNDTEEGDGSAQYLPQLSLAPDGRLDVIYYDRRADPNNVRNEVSLQSSFDGAESFRPRTGVADRPFDSRVGLGSERGMADLGSRLGILSTDSRALAVWTDSRTGTRASGKQDLSSAVVAFPSPDISAPASYALRYGGLLLALVGLGVLALWLAGAERASRLLAGLDGARRAIVSRMGERRG